LGRCIADSVLCCKAGLDTDARKGIDSSRREAASPPCFDADDQRDSTDLDTGVRSKITNPRTQLVTLLYLALSPTLNLARSSASAPVLRSEYRTA